MYVNVCVYCLLIFKRKVGIDSTNCRRTRLHYRLKRPLQHHMHMLKRWRSCSTYLIWSQFLPFNTLTVH